MKVIQDLENTLGLAKEEIEKEIQTLGKIVEYMTQLQGEIQHVK